MSTFFNGKKDLKRLVLIVVASTIMAANINSFVDAGGLFPGGFNGLTLLIQRIVQRYFGYTLPFTVVNLGLNLIPAVISFKFIGKKFTIYSGLMIVLTSVLTDILPASPLTYDLLLICVFGGIINGFAISVCLNARATSGGTDFIAVGLAEKYNIDAWNYILLGNALMLMVAGYLFGWEQALYSIIFQFTSTQIVNLLNLRYKQHTLLIVTQKPAAIYDKMSQTTHHSATILEGVGGYDGREKSLIYTVVSSSEVKQVMKIVQEIDEAAFVNVLKTEQLNGKFYREPND